MIKLWKYIENMTKLKQHIKSDNFDGLFCVEM